MIEKRRCRRAPNARTDRPDATESCLDRRDRFLGSLRRGSGFEFKLDELAVTAGQQAVGGRIEFEIVNAHRRLVLIEDLPVRNRKELHETFMIAAGGQQPIARVLDEAFVFAPVEDFDASQGFEMIDVVDLPGAADRVPPLLAIPRVRADGRRRGGFLVRQR